jgi:hypothetical protein
VWGTSDGKTLLGDGSAKGLSAKGIRFATSRNILVGHKRAAASLIVSVRYGRDGSSGVSGGGSQPYGNS